MELNCQIIIQLGYKGQMSTTSISKIWMLFHNTRRNEKKGKEIVYQEHKKVSEIK